MSRPHASRRIQIVVVEEPANVDQVFLELPNVEHGCIRSLMCKLPSEGHDHFYRRVASKVGDLSRRGALLNLRYFEPVSSAPHGATWRRQCEEFAARLSRAHARQARTRRSRAERLAKSFAPAATGQPLGRDLPQWDSSAGTGVRL
jgi:hypothetical protein